MKTFDTEQEAIDYSTNNPTETVEFKDYWNNGNLYEHSFFVDGSLHGEYKWYHKNGQLSYHCFYVNGNRQGEYKSYLSDGDLMFDCFYVNGELFKLDHLRDGSYKSLCIKHTLFNGNVFDEDI